MEIRKIFGDTLRQIHLDKGLSQEKFTELCGLHRTYLSDIECYQRNVPIDNIQKIADALGVASYILSMSKEEDIC